MSVVRVISRIEDQRGYISCSRYLNWQIAESLYSVTRYHNDTTMSSKSDSLYISTRNFTYIAMSPSVLVSSIHPDLCINP